MKKLVGEWEGKTEKGRLIRVTFRLTAADTVLVETWTLGPQRESLTLYHMDNESLFATHYCPIGNQPRLRLQAPSDPELLKFEFVSATNLPKPEAAHQHQFEIEFIDAHSFARSETVSRKWYWRSGTCRILKNHGSSLAAVKPLAAASDPLFQSFAAAKLAIRLAAFPGATPTARTLAREAARINLGALNRVTKGKQNRGLSLVVSCPLSRSHLPSTPRLDFCRCRR